MTVSTTNLKDQYWGDGVSNTFNVTAQFQNASELLVVILDVDGVTEIPRTLITHYNVTGGAGGIGTVVFTPGNIPTGTGAPGSQKVTIARNMPLTQATDLTPNDPFPADTVERSLGDRLIMIVQGQQEKINRSVQLQVSSSLASAPALLDPVANATLIYDPTGTKIIPGPSTASIAASVAAAAASAVAAAASASAASGSASAAATSASNAATSATSASTSATTATTQATNASNSATAAAGSATTASTQATNAAASAAAAATSATNASNSATSASTSASTATTQASNAATSATTASTQATNSANSASAAATSASNASTSASTATTQASNASTSASNAATSATNSGNSATAAAASAVSAAKRTTVAVTGNETLALTDVDKLKLYTGAGGHVETIPANATVAFAVEDEIDIYNYGTGNWTITAAAAVIVNGQTAKSIVLPPYTGGSLKKNATNTWIWVGYFADGWA